MPLSCSLPFQVASFPIACVQNAFSLWERACGEDIPPKGVAASSKKGVLRFCTENRIVFQPYAALGGLKARRGERDLPRDFPRLAEMARDKGVSPHALALAYMRHRWPCILHIVGSRRLSRAEELGSAYGVRFTKAELVELDRMKPR